MANRDSLEIERDLYAILTEQRCDRGAILAIVDLLNESYDNGYDAGYEIASENK